VLLPGQRLKLARGANDKEHASTSMDGCAHIMADAADHNKTRAAAAATASEEATTNVSNVAMAAEEIAAQSVEQISTQAARSAQIARQASDETKGLLPPWNSWSPR
jgi:methyl-accepting chemotaxis protein